MRRKININEWNRKEHYEFFSNMDNPSFGIVAEVEVTQLYEHCKKTKQSFFAQYLHRSMKAINKVEEFRLRIVDDGVYLYDVINAGSTIARNDGTFAFSYMHFNEDFEVFNEELQKEIKEVQQSEGLRLSNEELDVNLIRHSTFPWSNFTSILHPHNINNKESVPKIVFAKFYEKNGKLMMPVSIEAHHGLMDGRHIALYLQYFQEFLNKI